MLLFAYIVHSIKNGKALIGCLNRENDIGKPNGVL